MTNTQHTPGPWVAEPDALGEFSVSFKDGAIIADVYGRNPANARLIAAAPEMLDALQGLVANVARTEAGPHIDLAIAAIAKATGQAD